MIPSGKCPKCETLIRTVRIETVDGKVALKSTWRCITLCCPSCDTVLGVQIDPVALKADTIQGVAERLRGRY